MAAATRIVQKGAARKCNFSGSPVNANGVRGVCCVKPPDGFV